MRFNTWLDTLVSEKGLDLEHTFEVEGPEWGTNWIPLAIVIEAIKGAPKREQDGIKNMLVRIDFVNGSVLDYFGHLAKALAR